jgi:hypothetical protein
MENCEQTELQPQPTVEEIETQWWEPLGCKCDVEFDDE